MSTQLIGAVCLVLALASLPIAHDMNSGTSGVIASIVASLAAIVCGTLVWRGRLIPLALATGLDLGFGIGLPRGGSAVGGLLRILPAADVATAETVILVAAVIMFIASALCVLAVPTALALRQWARSELAKDAAATDPAAPLAPDQFALGTDPVVNAIDEAAPTHERPRLDRPSAQQPPDRPSAGGTLKGIGALRPSQNKLMPTQVIRLDAPARSKPLVIAGVAVTLIAIGIIVITAATSDRDTAPPLAASSGSSVTRSAEPAAEPTGSEPAAAAPAAVIAAGDAGQAATADAAAPPPTVEDFVAQFHAALANPAAAELAALLDAKAFGFGVESHDLAEGRDAIVAQLRDDLGAPPPKRFDVTLIFGHAASDGDVGWIAEQLEIGDRTFVVTAVVGLRDNTWTIGALHWAQAMPNDTAYRLAREGELAVPDAIPDAHDESPLAAAMRTAFASRPSHVEARSTRADAFNFGSAAERLKGGETIKRIFGRLRATIRLHDAVKVGTLGERGGWGVANVDFTDADRDGTEVTQTFRVLAAWVKEDAGWRVVQTHWSNAR